MKQTDLPLIFYYIVACVAVASALAPSNAAAMCRADWISPIEGVYTLQEWHTEAGVLAPPTVDGRLIFSNGAVGITGHNNADETKKISFALFGIYLTEGCQFSYRYTTNSTFTETPTDITASRTLPWEGMRVFTVTSEQDSTILRENDGKHEFNFSARGLLYSKDGRVLRIWKRIVRE